MTVAARQSNAQILEVKLQQHLQAAGFKKLPLYISCDFRDESLTVVGEHPRSLDPLKAKPTFAVLEAAILEIEPESIQQIGLCLKITGQKAALCFPFFYHAQPCFVKTKNSAVVQKNREYPRRRNRDSLNRKCDPDGGCRGGNTVRNGWERCVG